MPLPRKHKQTNTSVHWKHLLLFYVLRQLICVNFNQLKRSGYLSSQYPTPIVCSTMADRESKFSGEGETFLTMTEDLWMSEPPSLSTGGGAENTGRSSSSSSLVSSQSSSRLPLDSERLCFLLSDCLLLENQILTTSLKIRTNFSTICQIHSLLYTFQVWHLQPVLQCLLAEVLGSLKMPTQGSVFPGTGSLFVFGDAFALCLPGIEKMSFFSQSFSETASRLRAWFLAENRL